MITISSSGMRDSMRRFDGLSQRVVDGARNVLYRNMLGAQKELTIYPPQPSRTRAKTFNTYVRGVGSYPRSAFGGKTKSGIRPGARKGRYGKVRYTSQQLGKRWYVAQGMSRNVAEVVIGNSATYAPFVQSDEKQVAFHRGTGWITVEEAVRRRRTRIRNDINAMVQQLVARKMNEREFWITVRRALLMFVGAIEKRYGIIKTEN